MTLPQRWHFSGIYVRRGRISRLSTATSPAELTAHPDISRSGDDRTGFYPLTGHSHSTDQRHRAGNDYWRRHFGGLNRIANTARLLVPLMTAIYLVTILVALTLHASAIPDAFGLILIDAFSGVLALLLAVILYGVRQGAYSNERAWEQESLVHGAENQQTD